MRVIKVLLCLMIVTESIFALNINTASRAELMSLGLSKGEALAIMRYRKAHKFQSTDELFKVSGLSGAKALKIRDEVNVGAKPKISKPKQTTKNTSKNLRPQKAKKE